MFLLPLLVTFEHVPLFFDLREYNSGDICFCISNLDGFVNLFSADWVAKMIRFLCVPFVCPVFKSFCLFVLERSVQFVCSLKSIRWELASLLCEIFVSDTLVDSLKDLFRFASYFVAFAKQGLVSKFLSVSVFECFC